MRLFIMSVLMIVTFGISAADETFKFSGDLRTAYVNYNYDNGYFPNSEAGVVSAKLSATTKKWNNLYAKLSLTTVQGIDQDPTKQGMTYIFSEAWNGVYDSYSLLEESYIGYENNLVTLRLGRQEMDTPYINSDDYFVTPNSFEALTLKLTPLGGLVMNAGYVSKMSGTWDSSYDGANFHSMSRQAWVHYSDGTKDTYPVDAVYDIVGNQGISYIGATFKNNEHKLQMWDYYVHEMFNNIMMQYDYTSKYINAAIQYSTKREVGKLKDNPTYKIHYDVYGAKISGDIGEAWDLSMAYTGVSDNDSLHFFGSWGGYPEFASGMIVSYFETYLRDANIYALTSKHDLRTLLKGLRLKLRYAYYDLNSDYTVNINKDAPNGDDYMNAYGAEALYSYGKNVTLKIIYAGRKLESNNQSGLFRTVLKYKF